MSAFADLRRAGRALARRPALAATAAGTLALGVAAVALALSFRQAVLVAPVSFPDAGRLVDVLASRQGVDGRYSFYEADLVAYAEAAGSFEALGAYEPIGRRALTGAGEPRQLAVHRVGHGLLAALRVTPLHGRAFGPGDEAVGAPPVVIVSEHLWRDAFAADPALVGRDLVLDGTPHAVVGVMPGGFGLRGGYPDAWLPLPLSATAPRSAATLGAIGRLAPGVSLAAARAEAEAVALRLAASDPEAFEGRRFSLEPLVEVMTAGMRRPARLLAAAALLLLVLAATNGAALLLARTAERDREMAVRTSLGSGLAGRVGPVVAEALWLAAGGTAAGLGLAALVLPLLPDLHGRFLYRSIDLALAGPVVAGAVAAAFAAALAAVLPAAARAAAAGRSGALAALRGGSAPRGSQRLGSALVVVQLALACVLLAGAAALLASLGRLVAEDLGFEPEGVLAFEIVPPPSRYAGAAELTAFDDALRRRLSALPGVEVAATGSGRPASGWGIGLWRVDAAADAPPLPGRFLLVSPDWFEAAGVPLLRGRAFTAADRAGAEPVMVINEKAARRLFADRAAVGERVAFEERGDLHRVVGVVADARDEPGGEVEAACYLAHAQHADLFDTVGVRQRLVLLRAAPGVEPLSLLPAARRAVGETDPLLPLAAAGPLADHTGRYSELPRLLAWGGSLLAAVAALLAAVGVYGLLALAVARRRREIGVRVALGADRGWLMRAVVGRGVMLAAVGAAVGWPVSLLSGRALGAVLYGVSPADPWLLVGVVGGLVGVCGVAAVGPARRACRVDPAEALRGE